MKKSKGIFRKIVSVYEVLGGLAGLFLIFFKMLPLLMKGSAPSGLWFLYIILMVFFLLFLVSIIAGILLWMNKNSGYLWSFIIQLLQVPYLVTSALIYVFISGLNIAVYLTSMGGGLSFFVGSKFTFYLRRVVPVDQIGINIVALLLLIWVLIAWGRFRKAKGS